MFPKHKCGLYLTHNRHKDFYEEIGKYVNGGHRGTADSFKDDETRERSIKTDEIWELQWYPNTPVGFYAVAAPTLEECLKYALEMERGERY